ncbi:MAG: PaaI family thioesterase [Proteobacteria bacterium]|nr:PaaI family thioesterase [Pseudomonadota bacterium]MBU1451367.1 PaaI family thioesterase [Pseudomonadota bacterium]MBU2467606.1 PaaI family thioesterase [Pseudomonadota bacterium]MBU2517106.1 PaaI family thioesterase [Pseudomonadota bacterium]
MKRINPAWLKAIQSGVNPCPYFELQSMRIADVSWGKARLEIDLARKHLQPFGIVHGGVLSTIADAAGFWGVYSQMEPGLAMTTVELKVNFLAPTKDEGQLIAEGRCIKLGRTLGLGEATVMNSAGRVVAHATTTLMVAPRLTLVNQDDLPPKFLD